MILQIINQKFPLDSEQSRVFARTMKIVEELGELSDEILASMKLQRRSKMAAFDHTDIEDEFADVLASLLMLGIELNLDIEAAIQRKIAKTHQRLEQESDL